MRAKVSSKALTPTLHGAPQVILASGPSRASMAACKPQRFPDIQPSCNTSVELDVAKEEVHEKGRKGHGTYNIEID